MTRLLGLSNAFLKSIDSNLKTIYLQYIRDKTRYRELIDRLKYIRSQIDECAISARIDYLIARLNRLPTAIKNIVEVYKDEKLVGVLCDNIEKPQIEFIRDETEITCTHENSNENIEHDFQDITDEIVVYDDVSEFDNTNSPVLISLYTHDYRTFSGFTCIMLISTPEKTFAIDTLNVRDLRHKLFHCGTVKYFHCSKCYVSYKREFGNLGCYKTFNIETELYVDWRIRPLNKVMMNILKEDAMKMQSALTRKEVIVEQRVLYHLSEYNYTLFADENVNISELTHLFLTFYGIDGKNFHAAHSVLKLRNFIAKSNNESPWYVLTDKQVVILIVKKPETQESFLMVMERTSALAKEHMSDIVLIFRNLESEKVVVRPSPLAFNREESSEENKQDSDSTFSITDNS